MQSESDNTNTNNIQDAQNNRGPISSTKFKCIDLNIPTIEGSIAIYDVNNTTPPVITCIGYIVSISDDHNSAVIVLQIPRRGKVPCICPLSLIDESAIKVVKAKSSLYRKDYEMLSRMSSKSISITHTPAKWKRKKGHLILTGPTNIRGRVVDKHMLDSLEIGCLRKSGDDRSYYTLNRRFKIRKEQLRNSAQTVFNTPNGMKLCPAGYDGINAMVSIGEESVNSRLVYHVSISNAILELDHASNLPTPSLEEELLQISIGGDPKLLNVGKFLPCQGLFDNPKISVRCACGFVVDDTMHDAASSLLRCKCNCNRHGGVGRKRKK